MAPRASAVASSSRAPAKPTKAAASRPAAPVSAAPRSAKRAAAVADSDDDDELAVGGVLDFGDAVGDEPEEDGDSEGEDEEEDEFPELDSGSDGDVEGGDDVSADGEDADSDADSDAEALDDEATGSESGYNTSDIEALYSGDEDGGDHASSSSSPPTSPSSSASALALDPAEAVDRLIEKHTVKPDERVGADEKISVAKEGKGKLVPSRLVPGGYRREYDDIEAGYGSESSTEDNPNTVGNVPMEWYDDMPHIGYDVNGRKIFRPARGDELDKFLANVTDVAAWTSAEDKAMQQAVQLSDKELDIIRRLERAENPDADYDPYQPTIEWFTGEGRERAVPLSGAPEPKRRFVPSKWEHRKVMKIVKAIREGRIVPNAPAVSKPSTYAIWSETDAHVAHAMYMPAPQLPPPTTGESYNPPEEYLPTPEEQAAFDALDPEDRKQAFLPRRHAALRLVPAYRDTVRERFERALDLYLAPRTRRVKLNIDPESLVPKLPAPRELRPFPVAPAVQFRHPGSTRVRSVALSAAGAGAWLASGSEDGVVRLWDTSNGREVWRWDLGRGAVQHVEWSPSADEALLVALVEGRAAVLAPLALVDARTAAATLEHANAAFASSAASTKEDKNAAVKWARPSEAERERGVLVHVDVPGTPKQVTWHRKGDYFATVATEVLIHQLSKHATQSPFRKTPGAVQRVAFHPSRPHFFAATQRYVRVYDLAAQSLLRTLQTGLKWVSALDVHPAGDNLLVGSYDKKLAWFDMDLGTRPYRTLRYHSRALRAVAYHRTLPLFASASDDGTIHVFHATVYADFDRNPLIVPLKILRGHAVTDGLGVLDIRWHPEKPWLVSAGADGECRLWVS